MFRMVEKLSFKSKSIHPLTTIITSKYVYLDILCSVPQGSKCSGKLNAVMFADNTNFFLSGINIYSLFHPAALPVLKMDNIVPLKEKMF